MAVAQHPFGDEAEDDAGEDEPGDLFVRVFFYLLQFGLVHLERVEVVEFAGVLGERGTAFFLGLGHRN